MNCPSRPDHDPRTTGWNQNPSSLANDITTRNDFLGKINMIRRKGSGSADDDRGHDLQKRDMTLGGTAPNELHGSAAHEGGVTTAAAVGAEAVHSSGGDRGGGGGGGGGGDGSRGKMWRERAEGGANKLWKVGKRYARFVGPGFMVAVAYIDPGNYATDVAAGASYRFKLLFIILMSNIFAIFLQSLCVKLGSVTGMNLAENCKAHLPRWLNYVLYFFAESAIIATDIAEVIGTAIALNVLIKVPLVAGCAISILDVLIILFFYRPSGSMRGLRAFEVFVMALVFGVVICFCVQLSLIKNTSVGEVFKGFLPSSAIVESKGLYQSCGILGATVMPHSLYLGSGIVQSRLHEFDVKIGNAENSSTAVIDLSDTESEIVKYRPSVAAIKACMSYSIIEVAISLFTFALFVNSAILITAGASLYKTPGAEDADLFGIHDLLASSVSPVAGTIFALALLLSGTSAGIVCTIAGQMVSEGQLNWTLKPWVRRLVTRSISITPSIIIAGAVGRNGLSRALEGSQVALSVILPFVSAPLIWFTCRSQYMTVYTEEGVTRGNNGVSEGHSDNNTRTENATSTSELGNRTSNGDTNGNNIEPIPEARHGVQMRNHWITAAVALIIWGIIVVMNVALLVLAGKGI